MHVARWAEWDIHNHIQSKCLNHALIPLSSTLLPRLPNFSSLSGKHVMKSYNDMTQPPRYD